MVIYMHKRLIYIFADYYWTKERVENAGKRLFLCRLHHILATLWRILTHSNVFIVSDCEY